MSHVVSPSILLPPPSQGALTRSIHSELWAHAEKEFRQTRLAPLCVMKQKTSTGTWSYTIEMLHGAPHRVIRFNSALKSAIPFTPTP